MEIIILPLDFVSNHHVGLGHSLVKAPTHFTGIVDQFRNMLVIQDCLHFTSQDDHGQWT